MDLLRCSTTATHFSEVAKNVKLVILPLAKSSSTVLSDYLVINHRFMFTFSLYIFRYSFDYLGWIVPLPNNLFWPIQFGGSGSWLVLRPRGYMSHSEPFLCSNNVKEMEKNRDGIQEFAQIVFWAEGKGLGELGIEIMTQWPTSSLQ